MSIGISLGSMGNPFFVALSKGAEYAAKKVNPNVTITTVGYGDRYPVTAAGRLLEVGLLLGARALLGVVTASFASWLLDHVLEAEEDTQAATVSDIKALLAEVAELKSMLQNEHRPVHQMADGPVRRDR